VLPDFCKANLRVGHELAGITALYCVAHTAYQGEQVRSLQFFTVSTRGSAAG
jgi:hypothetical protein